MDLFEAMETCRAIRYLRPDPVSDELIDKVIWAATRAPSPGNSQGWDFVIVTDPQKKQVIGDAIEAAMAPRIAAMPRGDRTTKLMLDGALNLATTISKCPVLIFVCGPVIYPPQRPMESFTWSAIYPAAQNLVLAARALGLGTVFSTLHHVAEPLIRETLEIPARIQIGVTIPLGWPDRPFGPVARRPISQFMHRDGWHGDLRTD
jgi:nitroreductase